MAGHTRSLVQPCNTAMTILLVRACAALQHPVDIDGIGLRGRAAAAAPVAGQIATCGPRGARAGALAGDRPRAGGSAREGWREAVVCGPDIARIGPTSFVMQAIAARLGAGAHLCMQATAGAQ